VKTVTSTDRVPIAYEVRGSGSVALVFVHGWSCDRTYWGAQIEPFSREFQVVAVDLAGHGESGHERKAWTLGAFGEDVAAVVEELGCERVVLIGHSMGGDVIVEAAGRLRTCVAGLIWVDVYKQLGHPREPDEAETMIAPFRDNFRETTHAFVRRMFLPESDESLVGRVANDMSSAPSAIALEAMKVALTCERKVTDGLLELKLPAVAINPDDRPTDVESMKRFGMEVMVMLGVGHFLMMEDPQRFNGVLREAIHRVLG
jgi:pimeloyl-ACP methyl ester carboxylesterase